MHTTRISFVKFLSSGEDRAWQELDRAYRPMMIHWLRRYHLQPSDAEDVAQDVMAVVHRRVAEFDHNGRVGAFRNWLRTITVHTARNYLSRRGNRAEAPGSAGFAEMLAQLEDPASAVSREFDRQHDGYVVRAMLDRVIEQFQPSTVQAFRLHVLEGLDAKETADRLGLSVRAVYIAKSRVLRALREQAAGWIDELSLS